jgi:hypothetical protein
MACIASSITNVVALKATKVQVSAAARAPPATFRTFFLGSPIFGALGFF